MIAVDSTFLPLLLKHATSPPIDPATDQPITQLEERVTLLIDQLEDQKETVLIPTPVLGEFLVLAKQDGQKYLKLIDRNPLFKVADFDTLATIEWAAVRLDELAKMSKKAVKRETLSETKAKISFDRQIVVIAKVNNAHTIYSDDRRVKTFAEKLGIKVIRTWELLEPPKPPEDPQLNLDLIPYEASLSDEPEPEKDSEQNQNPPEGGLG